MQRTLVVKGKQRALPVRSIAEEIMGFSELDFRPYAEGLDRLSILSREVELMEEDVVGTAYYAYITKHKIITCLSWIMEFHMELNHILYHLQNKIPLSALSERNLTSHVYDEKTSDEFFPMICSDYAPLLKNLDKNMQDL